MSGFDTKKARVAANHLAAPATGGNTLPLRSLGAVTLRAACEEIDRLRDTLTATENALREATKVIEAARHIAQRWMGVYDDPHTNKPYLRENEIALCAALRAFDTTNGGNE